MTHRFVHPSHEPGLMLLGLHDAGRDKDDSLFFVATSLRGASPESADSAEAGGSTCDVAAACVLSTR